MAREPWHIKGELILSCNCTVFCPCVLSLGKHPPTEGYCQTWGGIRIDDGKFGEVGLSGINLGLIIEIPGQMSRGNWSAGVYIDNAADIYQVKALTRIMTGQAGGTTHLLSILVGRFLGVWQEDVRYETEGATRRFTIPKIIDGEIAPIAGKEAGQHTTIENSQYWIGPQIIVAQAIKSRFRGHGRNWDFKGRSAEICALDWKGP
ncbi:DUF1326 domain-containing protein [Taklimakanibacter deserti]|jgi:hypothetical protein|uniref:DUF1326 domain-containing protein n=1 Tax=Taklimakanibacter deserti TaxID=2267839 RepID=UPI000E655C7B